MSNLSTQTLQATLQTRITAAGGVMPFATFMSSALYEPERGYYTRPEIVIGKTGDFITAPTQSILFCHCLAEQYLQIANQSKHAITSIIEVGAGNGILAERILHYLAKQSALPERYYIVEISPRLRACQQARLSASLPSAIYERIFWFDDFTFEPVAAVVFANEVLDAMPVHLFEIAENDAHEIGVACAKEGFQWQSMPFSSLALATAVKQLQERYALADGYRSEVNLHYSPWLKRLAGILRQGEIFLIDYGFSGKEYYHPERHQGTLMCHYQQTCHPDPLIHVGQQDITSHVDFTALTEAAIEQGFQQVSVTTQANFLLQSGLLRLFEQANAASAESIANAESTTGTSAIAQVDGALDATPSVSQWQLAQEIKLLTMPHEMGELFKVLHAVVA